MRVEFSARALSDIDLIAEYGFVHFGEAAAMAYVAAIKRRAAQLADNPRLGTRYGETRRRLRHEAHHIYYVVDEERVRIVAVRGARMQPPD